MPRWTRLGVLALAGAAALVAAAAASAHAIVSPPVALAQKLEVFTLSVPTEEAGATTTKIELDLPTGFAIDSFAPPPAGWKQQVGDRGRRVIWSGGATPTEQDSVFSFNASTSGAGTYSFHVRQTYSNGKVVDWSGPESSDTPAPTVDAVSSLGGGASTLDVVALAVAGLALVVAAAALVARRGGRELA